LALPRGQGIEGVKRRGGACVGGVVERERLRRDARAWAQTARLS
jgi:hypothetical protein